MKLQHFVITRFCCRGGDAKSGIHWLERRPGPLESWTLNYRFRIFETVCLPALLGQTNQDFDWILVIDVALPAAWKDRLTNVCRRPRTHLVEYRAGMDLRRLSWLEPFMTSRPDHVITTMNDDDDALPRTFIESVQAYVQGSIVELAGAPAPPFRVIACKNCLEWDLVITRSFPMGRTAPWHRRHNGERYPVSCGFSLVCRYPAYSFSALSLRHASSEFVFDNQICARTGPS